MGEITITFADNLLYEALKAQIMYHKYLYYQLDKNEISDQEYDALEKRFDTLAERLGKKGSWVGWSWE